MKLRAYQTTDPTFWDDNRIRGLSESARTLAVYLLTNAMRSSEGLYGLPVALARDHLGWSAGRLERAADELKEADFATYDLSNATVLIHRGLKYNAPKGDTQIKGAVKTLDIANLPASMFDRFLAAADTYAPEYAAAIRHKFDRASIPPRYPLDGVSRDGVELRPSRVALENEMEQSPSQSLEAEKTPSGVNYF